MFTEKDFYVKLLNPAEVKTFIEQHGAFAAVCYNTPKDKAIQVGRTCLRSGHLSGSRHLYFKFDIANVPRFLIDQLVRHEIGVVKNVQSLRYCNKAGKINIYCPPEIYNNSVERFEFERTEEYLSTVVNRMDRLLPNIIKNNPTRIAEIERTLIPIGIESACSIALNLEALINLSHKRLCSRAELPIRQLVIQMTDAVIEAEPEYAEYLVPICDKMGYCPEGKMSCGVYDPK